jgi:hypothetical protein
MPHNGDNTHAYQHSDRPPGALPKNASAQFTAMLESAHQTRQTFPDFFTSLVDHTWQLNNHQFRTLLTRQLDSAIVTRTQKPGYKADTLPTSLQRYIKDRKQVDDYSHTQRYMSHPIIPNDNLLEAWKTGFVDPDGSQLALMAEAFHLAPKHEIMLHKMVHGHPLSIPILMDAINAGHSGKVTSLLVDASGFTTEHLSEILDIPYATLKGWTDIQRDRHRVMDEGAARRFARVMTMGLEDSNNDSRGWLLSAIQKDITGLLMGKNLRALPDSPQEASARFQLELEQSFAKGQDFTAFIQQLLTQWDAQASELGFLNTNNAGNPDLKHEEPLSKYTLYSWANGTEKPHAITMHKLVSGASLTHEQEMMLWKMSQGHPISIQDIESDLHNGHSGHLLRHLIEASGIPNSRLTDITHATDSMIHSWKHTENPKKIGNTVQARALVTLLTEHVGWPDAPITSEQKARLEERIIDQLTGKQFSTPLYEMALDAIDHEKPSGRLVHLLSQRIDMGNSAIADAIGVTPTVLSQLKMGQRPCSEKEAHRLITLAGGGADPVETSDITDVLTQTRSPSDLLSLAKVGAISIGDISTEIRKRRRLTRKEMQDIGIGKNVLETLERNQRQQILDIQDARLFADFIGYTGEERHQFVQIATGQALSSLQQIIDDARNVRIDEHETLHQLCQYTCLSTEEIAEKTNTPAEHITAYCNGTSHVFPFKEEGIDPFLKLCGHMKRQDRLSLKHIFSPDAERLLNLTSLGKQSREDTLVQLMALADITPTILQDELHIPPITSQTASLLMKDHELPNLLALLSDRLHLSTSEHAWLATVYAPECPDDTDAFKHYMERYRRQVIGTIVQSGVDYAVQWDQLLNENKQFLDKWDEYAESFENGRTKQAILTIRDFLKDRDNTRHFDSNELYELGREAVRHIKGRQAPNGNEDDKTWQGDVYDAVNKCLFQKLCKCREKLGMGEGIHSIAKDMPEARQQKAALMADPEGLKLLTAIQAFNHGNAARLCSRLRYLPKYKNQDDSGLFHDIWFGPQYEQNGRLNETGLLEVFLKWKPAIARFSTYVDKPARWLAYEIAKAETIRSKQDGLSHSMVSSDGEQTSSLLDQVAYAHYKDKPQPSMEADEVEQLLHKVNLAVAMLPTREKAVIQALFNGISEGDHITLNELIPAATGSHTKQITGERMRQLRNSAYQKFMDAWETVAEPGDEIPVGLKAFLENMKRIPNKSACRE